MQLIIWIMLFPLDAPMLHGNNFWTKPIKKKTFFTLFILIVLVSSLVVLKDYISEKQKIIKEIPKETKLEERISLLPVQVQEEMFTLSGEIVEIKGNEIILRIIFPVLSKLGEIKTEIKKITVTNETEFLKQSVEIKKEEIGKVVFFFSVPQLKPIQLKDLKVGEQILVTSKENLGEKEEIIASQIIVSESK